MPRSIRCCFITAGFLAALYPIGLSAQHGSDPEASPWGVGFQISWPSYGLSGLYDVNERVTVQGSLGALGTVTSFGGRGIYRFQTMPKYNLFGFGGFGVWRWDGGSDFDSESVVGIGAGGGIELAWQKIVSDDDSFPPLFSTIELGFTSASFENYNLSAIGFGWSLHYRF